MPMHGSLLHLVITSEDGDDYYHLHPQGDGTDGVVTAQGVQFRRDGVHLVAATWAVRMETGRGAARAASMVGQAVV